MKAHLHAPRRSNPPRRAGPPQPAPYPIASSSSIMPEITDHPPSQNFGCLASSPDGTNGVQQLYDRTFLLLPAAPVDLTMARPLRCDRSDDRRHRFSSYRPALR